MRQLQDVDIPDRYPCIERLAIATVVELSLTVLANQAQAVSTDVHHLECFFDVLFAGAIEDWSRDPRCLVAVGLVALGDLCGPTVLRCPTKVRLEYLAQVHPRRNT